MRDFRAPLMRGHRTAAMLAEIKKLEQEITKLEREAKESKNGVTEEMVERARLVEARARAILYSFLGKHHA